MRRYLHNIWANKTSPRPVIAMYHRFADLAVDPWGLAVKPSNFAAQVALLSRNRTVLPLTEFVSRAFDGTLPDTAVALTVDDGYYDNLICAGPILACANMPASLFLATGPAEYGVGYWWDEVAAMILDAPPMAATIDIAGVIVSVALGPREAADDDRLCWRAWEPRTARERLHYAVWDKMRPLPPPALDRALLSLRLVFGARTDDWTRAMTLTEVSSLIAMAPVELGGHTADHVDLPALDRHAALEQILQGKDVIQTLTGGPPVGFAYPYGRHDRATRRLIETVGLAWACTTEHGFVTRWSDRFRLPRIAALDVPHIDWLL